MLFFIVHPHSGSRDKADTIVFVHRVDVDWSTVSVSVTVRVDDSIGIVPVISDNVGIPSVSSVVIDNHRSILVMPTAMHVTIDNDSLAVTVSTSTTGFDDGGVVSVSIVRDDSRGISVPSRGEEGLDFAEEGRRGVGFSFTFVDVDHGSSVSVVSGTTNNDDLIIPVSSSLKITINDGDLVYVSD